MMMTVKFKTTLKGYYSNYRDEIEITHGKKTFKISSATNAQIDYDVTSDDGGAPGSCTVTLYNVAKESLNDFAKGDHIVLKSGPADLYGILTEGDITKVNVEAKDGQDRATVISFTEGTDYTKLPKMQSKFNGSKMVKKTVTVGKKKITYTKKQVKKLNITFRNKVTAKQLISRIKSEAKIKISSIKLKENHVYKKGYTISSKPLAALKSIVKDCKSKMYYRHGSLVIETGADVNPYNEHLFLSLNTGLRSLPVANDGDGGESTFTLECEEDPRIVAGSAVDVDSEILKGTYRVKNAHHTHDRSSYGMELTVHA